MIVSSRNLKLFIFNFQLSINKVPIYEYKCASCGNQLELMQKISDAPLMECPKCSGKLEKQWSLSGFQFKGSGWYVSDYTNRGKDANSETKSVDGANAENKNADGKTADANATASSETTKSSESTKTSSGESTASATAASKPEA